MQDNQESNLLQCGPASLEHWLGLGRLSAIDVVYNYVVR